MGALTKRGNLDLVLVKGCVDSRWMRLQWFWMMTLLVMTQAGRGQEEVRPVVVGAVERGVEVREMEITGSVTAKRQARLSARTAGLVRDMKVDAGDVMKAGDVLMELDDELAGLAVERVAAEREQAELEVTEARRLEEEVRDLAKSGAFSRSEADTRVTNLRLKQAALKRSDFQEREQRAILERHQLVAPFDGVISRKLTEAGEWVTEGTPVVELVETKGVRMDVQVPQEWVGRLRGNVKVRVRLDAYPERELPGKVGVAVPVKDPVARTFLVRIELEDAEGLAAPGMSGKALFAIEGEKEVIRVPRDAVVRFSDGTAQVWAVVNEGGQDVAKARVVKVVNSLGSLVEVSEGLDGGERVVVRGNESLRDGMPVAVRMTEEDKKTEVK